jgi:HPt (histidine-containing phosphotransfer) domain-containing protein
LLRSVHTLKSSGAAVGALALSRLAAHHEQQLRSKAPPGAGLPAALRAEYARFEQALAAHRRSQARQEVAAALP